METSADFKLQKAPIEKVTDYMNEKKRQMNSPYVQTVQDFILSGMDCAEVMGMLGSTARHASRFRNTIDRIGAKDKCKVSERGGKLFLYKPKAAEKALEEQ